MNPLTFYLLRYSGLLPRPEVSAWELDNIRSANGFLAVLIDRRGITVDVGKETPRDKSAGRSLVYFLGLEILQFDLTVRKIVESLEKKGSELLEGRFGMKIDKNGVLVYCEEDQVCQEFRERFDSAVSRFQKGAKKRLKSLGE